MHTYRYEWRKQLGRGTYFEHVLDEHFCPRYNIIKAKGIHQKMGIDRFFGQRIVTRRGTGEFKDLWFAVEYKTDEKADRSGNVFVEIEMRRKDGTVTPGWALKIMAQVLIVLLPESRLILWVNVLNMKTFLGHWLQVYMIKECYNKETPNALGLLVPLQEFRTACVTRVEKLSQHY